MKIFTQGLVVAALAGTMGLTACQTQQPGRAPKTEGQMTRETVMDPKPGGTTLTGTTTAPEPGRQQVARGGWPTMQSTAEMAWSATAIPTGEARTSVIGLEIGAPPEVRANQPFDAMIIVTNLTDREVGNVVVKESFGSSYSLRSASMRGRQNADGTVTWLIENLAPRESKTIRLTGAATGPGDIRKCVAAAYDIVACTNVVVVDPQLQITKSAPTEVLACDEIVYTFRVSNTGTGTVQNVKINDPLPEGLMTADGGRTLTLDVGNVGEGQTREMTARVRASGAGSFANRAQAMGDGGVAAESNEVTTMVRKPELQITKVCPQQGFLSRPLRYELTVRNVGNGEARNTVLEDIIPAGATVLNASDGGRSAAGKVTWDLGTLAPDQARTVTLTVQSDAPGTLVNRATAQAFCADMVSDTCSTELRGIPAILLEVIDVEDPDLVGTTDEYIITVTNQGSAPATNIRIVCTLEEQHEYESSTGPTAGTARGPKTVEFAPLPSLAPKAKATWVVVVRAAAPGDVRFKVQMTSDIITRPVEETEATRFYQ
jgi:uncharacterized repeat protein (TIGR01451 family)